MEKDGIYGCGVVRRDRKGLPPGLKKHGLKKRYYCACVCMLLRVCVCVCVCGVCVCVVCVCLCVWCVCVCVCVCVVCVCVCGVCVCVWCVCVCVVCVCVVCVCVVCMCVTVLTKIIYLTFDRGESKIFQKGPLVVCAWHDSKVLTVLSTTSQPVATGSVLRRQRDGLRMPVSCPDSIIIYNKHMEGVDRGDQIRGYYSCRTRSRKFYKFSYLMFLSMLLFYTLIIPPSRIKTSASNWSQS